MTRKHKVVLLVITIWQDHLTGALFYFPGWNTPVVLRVYKIYNVAYERPFFMKN
jgi:hypothetical protein